jgi:hypothetical protein
MLQGREGFRKISKGKCVNVRRIESEENRKKLYKR